MEVIHILGGAARLKKRAEHERGRCGGDPRNPPESLAAGRRSRGDLAGVVACARRPPRGGRLSVQNRGGVGLHLVWRHRGDGIPAVSAWERAAARPS